MGNCVKYITLDRLLSVVSGRLIILLGNKTNRLCFFAEKSIDNRSMIR